MSAVRVGMVLLGTAALPLPLGTAPLWADTVGDLTDRTTSSVHERTASAERRRARAAKLDRIAVRLERLEEDVSDLRAIATKVDPLKRVLVDDHSAPPEMATRIAAAVVREGYRTGLDTGLLLAVLLVENPWLDPEARSSVGAVGLMQVMPFHAGAWRCGGADLTDPEVNICHGARILAHALHRARGDLDTALLRYNGCVRGRNTPDCHRYPSWVRHTLEGLSGGRVDMARADAP